MNPRQSPKTSPPFGLLFFGFLRILIALMIFAIPVFVLIDSFKTEDKEISPPIHSNTSPRPTPIVRPTPLPFNQGEHFTVKVPLGQFTIKYASGDTWYGYNYFFGPETVYNKANSSFTFARESDGYSGYTITLYKVRNGNLKTQAISAHDF